MIRTSPKYEAGKTYPIVVGHRIKEVDGETIMSWIRSSPKTLTNVEYGDILERLEELENNQKKILRAIALLEME